MKKILIATDLSPRSDRALERALAIGKQLGAEVVALHVVDDGLPGEIAERQQRHAEQAIRAMVAGLAGQPTSHFSVTTVRGKDYAEVLAHAEVLGAELLIIGTHRYKSRDLVAGTTAERVIRLGACPTLVVRERVAGPYASILAPVDLSVHSRRALEVAVAIAPGSRLHLLHAYDAALRTSLPAETREAIARGEEKRFRSMIEHELKEVCRKLPAGTSKPELTLRRGSVLEALREEASRVNPDLVAVGTHGRTGAARDYLGSVAEAILVDPPTDLLIAKAW